MTLRDYPTIDIEEEMRRSYMDYAMSVIVGRALPDARDGLKPVHRRILYAMEELGVQWNKPFKKSARIVGDVIGKYHPHGDSAVYDATVRMVQEFSLRYPLVNGQGNFGSVDGDSPAAMRYTEVRLSRIAHELLADLDKETVEFGPNYDDSLREPLLLPTKIPNLLVNGSTGIAVGMATNIPPHNLTEVVNGCIHLIDHPDATVDHLMAHITGPDFPTAGIIHGLEGIREAYRTGRGRLQLRARSVIEKAGRKSAHDAIIITELPYTVNKARLIEKIAELVRDRKIEGVAALRDESGRDGMRVVIEVKRDDEPQAVLNQLYKHTQLQTTFGIIFMALVDNRPQVLDLRQMLVCFIDHRKVVVTRRTEFELQKAQARAHLLEGLTIALDHLDAVIRLIRAAASPEAARTGLMESFSLSQIQAQAILDMRLQRLTALERDKILAEYKEVLATIDRLEFILANEAEVYRIIKEELVTLRDQFGDQRRTQIVPFSADISIEDMIADEEMAITVSHGGYIKRNATSLYRAQRRGGKGKMGMQTREEDFVEHLFIATSHDTILFFTDRGRVYRLKVYEIPEAGRAARGKAIVNLLSLAPGEKVAASLTVRDFPEDRYVVMATRKGVVKRSALAQYANIHAAGIIAATVDANDEVIAARLTTGDQEILLATRNGKAIHFKEGDVRAMGRTSRGVRGITLQGDDQVVAMEVITPGTSLLTVTENGFGKRTEVEEYPIKHRGGQGVITIKTTKRNGKVVGVKQVADAHHLMLFTEGGKIIRIAAKGISVIGRNAQGVTLVDLENDRVSGVMRLAEAVEEYDDDEEGAEE
ncbi:MAG: DNA gyrase subunit A [Nitrospirae bacterium CG18_big_fil_WC_8_21_14_2_50_70_55]|nr:DNA gyrase subunit A [Deltaproteobacteria bacterium]OIP63526.1 MAG: DNA gyrase subunit A [Nitrospirae bacterium CG2_30_70_394]PIQ04243.1 MAG: DNA gyrase subunit A [Nitrospirae bacterium CG18_big_fil_WC_8_21_14_2_50_70_55]PIU78745.1 MAG: DNA gyrase subunit A [Nitrospirae bacterium CG06_land_8_20_14_3_00_70_43]PIW82539.1 MAG: DNA gyrase subunit A [Nitrospirae bacterium CG_4_8_14_3_um_filter_70_85]PIX83134.1 MAG: DNA gyrase subunit A [Nitrospirae bacterium CG_4_10_14_3_um_filter_70_108]PJB953